MDIDVIFVRYDNIDKLSFIDKSYLFNQSTLNYANSLLKDYLEGLIIEGLDNTSWSLDEDFLRLLIRNNIIMASRDYIDIWITNIGMELAKQDILFEIIDNKLAFNTPKTVALYPINSDGYIKIILSMIKSITDNYIFNTYRYVKSYFS